MEEVVNTAQLRSYYNNKKVFVTGHTGFKGSWLTQWLTILGAKVKGYALEPELSDCLFNIMKPQNNTESIIADIRDKQVLQRELLSFQPDFVFHLAAQPLVRRSYQFPALTFEVNVAGTANVLEAVNKLQKKCTIIVVTTDKVYENKERDILYKEDDLLGGYDPYSASKACTELVANSFRNSFFNPQQYDIHEKAIATARAGNVIGGGDYSEDRIIPDIIKALGNRNNIEVRNPESIRPWQHVLEPLGGYLLLGGLMDTDPVGYQGAYNFGPEAGDHLTVKELVELAVKRWGSGNWKDINDGSQPHEAQLLKLDITKAKDRLNWQPKLMAGEAIEWTIDWYKNILKNNSGDFTLQQITNYMDR